MEDMAVSIKPCCTEHPPWPRGICFKCRLSALTLSYQVSTISVSRHSPLRLISYRLLCFWWQTYRHVDSVMFKKGQIVDKFLSYWRVSGYQRIGFLYGNYEQFPDVPLSIRLDSLLSSQLTFHTTPRMQIPLSLEHAWLQFTSRHRRAPKTASGSSFLTRRASWWRRWGRR